MGDVAYAIGEGFAGDLVDVPEAADLHPAKRLMWAVLGDAIRTVIAEHASAGMPVSAVRNDAAWIAADDWASPFSFVNICDALGVSPARIRQWVAAERTRRRPRVAILPIWTASDERKFTRWMSRGTRRALRV